MRQSSHESVEELERVKERKVEQMFCKWARKKLQGEKESSFSPELKTKLLPAPL